MSAPGDAGELAARSLRAMLEKDAFSLWLGLEIVAMVPDGCTVRMTVRPEMLNGFGVCHGGVTFSLADSAFAFAANQHGRVAVAVDSDISYPAAARAGDVLTASAERDAGSARLGYYRVVVRNQRDETVALFRGTVYRTEKPLLPSG